MEWISVKDKLPEFGAKILVFENLKDIPLKALAWPLIGCPYDICEFGTYGNGFINSKNNELKHVTHWMFLPGQPKE